MGKRFFQNIGDIIIFLLVIIVACAAIFGICYAVMGSRMNLNW